MSLKHDRRTRRVVLRSVKGKKNTLRIESNICIGLNDGALNIWSIAERSAKKHIGLIQKSIVLILFNIAKLIGKRLTERINFTRTKLGMMVGEKSCLRKMVISVPSAVLCLIHLISVLIIQPLIRKTMVIKNYFVEPVIVKFIDLTKVSSRSFWLRGNEGHSFMEWVSVSAILTGGQMTLQAERS
jgi:hypothetical protein